MFDFSPDIPIMETQQDSLDFDYLKRLALGLVDVRI
jgi:hypothetical protein